jgi:adhesin/invasin
MNVLVRNARRSSPILWLAAVAALPALLSPHSQNVPTGFTGGFGEPNCTRCHTGAANPPGGSVTIGSPVAFVAATTYAVTITIQDSAPDRTAWGFQLSARFRDDKQAGNFLAKADLLLQTSPASGVQYVSHQPAVMQAGNKYTYTVNWVAPPVGSPDEVFFSAAGVAADGSGTGGDHVYIAQAVSVSSLSVTPHINAGGVVNAASYEGTGNSAAPGSIIAIFGTKLANGTLESKTFPLPTQAAGTLVLINGMPAPLFYVSPLQINAQMPFIAPGQTVKVIVQNTYSLNSAEEVLQLDSYAPAFFTLDASGQGPAAAQHLDYSPVNAAAPLRPGEWAVLYCTGLGQTQPPALEEGKPAIGQRTLVVPGLTVGGATARVDYAGAAPTLAGVYQINAIVPSVPAGDQELILTIGGKSSRSGVTVRVQP